MQKRFLSFSGFSGAIAVALGAMGAHFLKTKLESGALTTTQFSAFETAVQYHILHSIVLLIVALFVSRPDNKLFIKAGYCFMGGIVLFSGSLYLLSTGGLMGLENIKWIGPVTPIGGVFFIAGWIFLAVAGVRMARN